MSRGGLSTRLIQIDLDYVQEKRMSVNQYLALMKLYLYEKELKILPIRIYEDELEFLEEQGYIARTENNVLLTDTGRGIFEQGGDLFEEFFSLFPHRVPNNAGGFRVLGTKASDTIMGNKMRRKWNLITKGNATLQKTIIESLRYELKHREQTGALAYMQNMETWLNNGTWERYQDMIEEEKNTKKREDKIL